MRNRSSQEAEMKVHEQKCLENIFAEIAVLKTILSMTTTVMLRARSFAGWHKISIHKNSKTHMFENAMMW